MLSLLGEHDVLCLSRDPDRLPRRHGLNSITADLGKSGDWLGEISRFRPDWCLHLAWEGLPDYSLERCRVNLDASIRLLDAVSRSGVKRVVVAGTCWEYGNASGAVAEDDPPLAVDVFAATKEALLRLLASIARVRGFEYRWARIFFVYGPGQRSMSLIPHLHSAYAAGQEPDIREPEAVQDFVHVDDVAAALMTLAATAAPSGVFNVGSGQPTKVGQIANRVADYYGKKRPFLAPREGRGYWADVSKIHSLTGWRGRIGLEEGIDRTLAALNGELRIDSVGFQPGDRE